MGNSIDYNYIYTCIMYIYYQYVPTIPTNITIIDTL